MQLRVGENILAFRKKKKIKQEELADFLGVTKASVSKWETKQSYPDILLLPQIAAFFGITIDDLLGYEPQLSKEQITKLYSQFTEEFADKPFEEVMKKSKDVVKEYYSCYLLQLYMSLLWLNHFNLVDDSVRQKEILNDVINISEHIMEDCKDVSLVQDAIVIRAMVQLQLGNVNEVIEVLKPMVNMKKYQLAPDTILIQALQMSGNPSEASLYNQVGLLENVVQVVSNSIQFISLHMDDKEKCETLIERTSQFIELYEIQSLSANVALQFYYQTALFYCTYSMVEKAMKYINQFVNVSIQFIRDGFRAPEDKFFDRVNEWMEESTLGVVSPRNEKVVFDSLGIALQHPAFKILAGNQEFEFLKKRLDKKGE